MRTLFTAAFACLAVAVAHGASPVVEINETIDYLRIRKISESLNELDGALSSNVLIVDLRYVGGDASEAASLGNGLARSPFLIEIGGKEVRIAKNAKRADKQLTLVLVNSETRGAIENILAALQAAGDVSLIGSATAGAASTPGAGVAPELRIAVNAEIEKAAYQAYENGTPLDDLLDAPVEKKRYDEALLLREFDGTSNRPKNPTARSEDSTSPDSAADTTEPPPLVDRTLQRAVNTAIALRALRKI